MKDLKCPQIEEMVRYLDGEVSMNRHEDLDRHFQQCSACSEQRQQLQRMLIRLQPDEGEFRDPRLVSEVMHRIEKLPAAPVRERSWLTGWRVAIPALAAAAVVAVVVLWMPRGGPQPQQEQPQFLARGGAQADAERWVALWIYEKDRAGNAYRRVEREISPDASLVFGYRNLKGAHDQLMIFAVDGSGEVFWYYPAYHTPGTDPRSIDIRPGRHELADEIQHELRPGILRVFGLFSQGTLKVSEVERLVKQTMGTGKKLRELRRLPLPGTAQVSRMLRVVSRGSEGR